jgi:hypothetical protein
MKFTSKYRTVRTLAGIGILIALVLLLTPVATSVSEVGDRDAVIGFTVKDDDADQPIPNATIHIHRIDAGFCRDEDVDHLSLACDIFGHASHLVEKCMWSSTRIRFVTTFGMHLPHWLHSAAATGFARSEELYLDDGSNNRNVKSEQPAAKLNMAILLRKKAD